ncbi:MAG TPA: hypothetical protein VGH76_27235 [Actinomycetospora sp.]
MRQLLDHVPPGLERMRENFEEPRRGRGLYLGQVGLLVVDR